ncbi:VOC family protein [Paenibacillus cymbidii]|uniref:VOC family protein n=1 Tax=Paenibacillus cymbidii TaxID=1639034 RepID=UPI001F341BED|nr:VOC family protein [Paenibacillus cymbidii]
MINSANGSMPRIVPHLWFDKEAKEAAAFYCAVFPQSRITSQTVLGNTPSGDCDLVSFLVRDQPFMAISAGPYFRINPAISFIVNFDPSREADASAKLDAAWDKLSDGGTALMPLDRYPFSERYGWIQDKFGVSWQLMLTNPDGESRPAIIPSLLFAGDNCGRAEEARNHYLSLFRNTAAGPLLRYGPGQEPDREGTVMFTDFKLEHTWIVAMDSAHEHNFQFNEAVSLLVVCDTQEEIDHYWSGLSHYPEAEQCGWLKDKFGVSWQISPAVMDDMMAHGTPEQLERVTKAFMKMKKFDIAALQRAYQGE